MGKVAIFCAVFSGISVIMDAKWDKVYNFWICAGWAASFLLSFFPGGWSAVRMFFGGTAIPILVLFPLFVGKMLGTGDIKVFAVLGSAVGGRKILLCMILSFLLGVIPALWGLLFRCDAGERFSYFFTYLQTVLRTGTFPAYLAPGKRPENIHFTIPIFGSVLLLISGGIL